jgi:sulfide:quinone oxidoreductase
MKCAGAPLKHTFLIDDIARTAGNAGKTEIIYAANNQSLFGVPIVSEKVRMLFANRGITPAYSHVLKSIEPGSQRATFTTPTATPSWNTTICTSSRRSARRT